MKIFYNPKCSTCRNTLELLREKGIEPEIVEYLKTPPSRAELENVISLLGIRPLELVRVKEPVWKEKYAGKNLSDSQVIDAMLENPILIERPVLVSGSSAMVCRPYTKAGEWSGD